MVLKILKMFLVIQKPKKKIVNFLTSFGVLNRRHGNKVILVRLNDVQYSLHKKISLN